MAVFVELVTDAFQATFAQKKEAADQSRRAGSPSARRPLRGLEIKDDTYAIIKVVTSTGREVPLIDAGSSTGRNTQYTNFILQSVQEARMEKHQIVETFGESYIFFFGEAPRFLDVQAILVDSEDFNWYAEFWENYDRYLRGTKSVELGARTYLFYDDNIVEGYMLNASAAKMSEQPLMARLQFRLYLTNYSNVSLVEDPNYPVRGSLVLPEGVDIRSSDAYTVLGASSPEQRALNQSNEYQSTSDDLSNLANSLRQQLLTAEDQIELLEDSLERGTLSNDERDDVEARLDSLKQSKTLLEAQIQGLDAQANQASALSQDTFNSISKSLHFRPLRSLIADNWDEFTGAPPGSTSLEGENDNPANGTEEAENLPLQSLQALQSHGADASNPKTLGALGLGPSFSSSGVAIGRGQASAGASFGASSQASFGVREGVSFRGTVGGGTGGGFGFSGRSSASAGFGASTGFSATTGGFIGGNPVSTSFSRSSRYGSSGLADQLNSSSFKNLVNDDDVTVSTGQGGDALFDGGVQVSGGLTSGAGVGGGISRSTSTRIVPGSFRFQRGSGASSFAGTGNGASVNVGGKPSAFAIVSVEGELKPPSPSFHTSFSLG